MRVLRGWGGLCLALALWSADAEGAAPRRALTASQVEPTGDVDVAAIRGAMDHRDASIAMLEDMLAGDVDAARKPEMMHRLAEMDWEQGRSQSLLEMSALGVKQDECEKLEGCDPSALVADTTASSAWFTKAVRVYQGLLAGYPRYARADEATYDLGMALLDLGRKDEANDAFTKLVKQYPDSAVAGDAWLQIGEHWFDADQPAKAMLAYQKASRSTSSMAPFATYKLAWCLYNLGEYGDAITTMRTLLVKPSAPTPGTPPPSDADKVRLQLQDEALGDLVRFYGDDGDLEEARHVFETYGRGDLYGQLLARLASTYAEHGDWDASVTTYRRLVAESPSAPDAARWEAEIVRAYRQSGRDEDTLTELDRALRDYGPKSSWARANASSPDVVAEARDGWEKALREAAVAMQTHAKKTTGSARTADQDHAERAWKAWLAAFPDDPHAADVRFAYAELLYDEKRWDEAYDQYVEVVRLAPDGKNAQFSARAAILAAKEVVGDTKDAGPEAGTGTSPEPLTEAEQRLVAACDAYAARWPDDDTGRGAVYEEGYVLYRRHHFAEAGEKFAKVIAAEPRSARAEQAAHLTLDSLALVEDWDALAKEARAFAGQDGLGSAAFRADVAAIADRAEFKAIEARHDRDADDVAAADAFARFATAHPSSELAAKALHDAGVYADHAGKIEAAIAAHRALTSAPYAGKTPYYASELAALGYDLESIASFADAAGVYETLADADPQGASTPAALYSAAVFRAALGDVDRALADGHRLVTSWPADARAEEMRVDLARWTASRGRWADAAAAWQEVAAHADDPALARLAALGRGEALTKAGADGGAVWRRAWADWETSGDPGDDAIAEIGYRLGEDTFQADLALKITGAPGAAPAVQNRAIGRTLKAKAEAVAAVEASTEDVVRTSSGPWGIAALVRLGHAYDDLADDILASPVPDYLDADQTEDYREQLADQAWPIRQKAIATYTAAVGKAYELGVYGDAVRDARQRLQVLVPDGDWSVPEALPSPRYVAGAVEAFAPETDL